MKQLVIVLTTVFLSASLRAEELVQAVDLGDTPLVVTAIAGQPYQFLVDQLVLFRERKRPNLAMVEYIDDRQMPDPDIQDIATYLTRIELPTRLAPIDENDPGFDALARLEDAKRVIQIPRAEGDVEAGHSSAQTAPR